MGKLQRMALSLQCFEINKHTLEEGHAQGRWTQIPIHFKSY